jgi:hypothetical protein
MWQFFVCGLNEKSGTTWMQIMLDAHPDIMCKGESCFVHLLKGVAEVIQNHQQMVLNKTHEHHRHFYCPPDDAIWNSWESIVTRGMEKALDEQIKFVGDKTPSYCNILEPMMKTFPQAKFIVMVRDIRDVVASGWSSEQAHNKQWCIDNFQDKAKNYAKLIMDIASQRAMQIRAAMNCAPDRLRLVHYEDLINSVETEMMTLTEWLTGSTDHLSTMIKAGQWKKLTGGRTQGQEDRNNFFRKGVVGDHENVLDSDTIEYMNSNIKPISEILEQLSSSKV